MSGFSDNLAIPTVADNQTQKTRAFNSSDNALDNAMNRTLPFTFTANARALTQAEYTRNFRFKGGNQTGGAVLTVPLTHRNFAVQNTNATYNIVVGGTTGGTVTVAPLTMVEIFCDGVDCTGLTAPTTSAVSSVLGHTGAVTLADLEAGGLDVGVTLGVGHIVANTSSVAAVGTDTVLSALLDLVIASSEGAIMARGTAWTAVAAGTPGQVLVTQGTTALPGWHGMAFGDLVPINSGLVGNAGTGTAAAALIPLASSLDFTAGSLGVDFTVAASRTYADAGDAAAVAAADTFATAADVVVLAAAANASNLTSGTIPAARLPATTVTPGVYGDATHVGTFTVGADGRITAAGTAAIPTTVLNEGTISALAAVFSTTSGTLDLVSTAVTAGAYGDATHVGQFTVDAKGRLTAAASVLITGAAPSGTVGGDLSGTFPNPTVAKINGVPLGTVTATAGNLLIADGSSWVSVAMTGDGTINSGGTLVLNQTSVVAKAQHTGTVTATTTGTVNPAGLDSVLVNVGSTAATLTVSPGFPYQRMRLMIAQGATAHAVTFDSTVSPTADITAYVAGTVASKVDLLEIFANSTGSIWSIGAVNHGAVL